MFNGQVDNGEIYHLSYSRDSAVFGDIPTSGELTIHGHEQKIILPNTTEQTNTENKEIKILTSQEEHRKTRRRLGSGFLSVQSNIETI